MLGIRCCGLELVGDGGTVDDCGGPGMMLGVTVTVDTAPPEPAETLGVTVTVEAADPAPEVAAVVDFSDAVVDEGVLPIGPPLSYVVHSFVLQASITSLSFGVHEVKHFDGMEVAQKQSHDWRLHAR